MRGFVKAIVKERGFGFIVPDNGTPDLFFHVKSLIRVELFDEGLLNQEVEFDQINAPDGRPRATNVRPAT